MGIDFARGVFLLSYKEVGSGFVGLRRRRLEFQVVVVVGICQKGNGEEGVVLSREGVVEFVVGFVLGLGCLRGVRFRGLVQFICGGVEGFIAIQGQVRLGDVGVLIQLEQSFFGIFWVFN